VNWSNLPDDLLAMIRWRVPSPRGRIRLAAICRSWRAAMFQQLAPPAFPLLLLLVNDRGTAREKHFYCPEDGGIL
jgi:hypothetical protein